MYIVKGHSGYKDDNINVYLHSHIHLVFNSLLINCSTLFTRSEISFTDFFYVHFFVIKGLMIVMREDIKFGMTR